MLKLCINTPGLLPSVGVATLIRVSVCDGFGIRLKNVFDFAAFQTEMNVLMQFIF